MFKNNVDPYFVIYWTHSRKYRMHIKNHAVGSTQIHLKKKTSSPISLPTLENKEISQIHTFDAKIELNKKRVKILKICEKYVLVHRFDPVRRNQRSLQLDYLMR